MLGHRLHICLALVSIAKWCSQVVSQLEFHQLCLVVLIVLPFNILNIVCLFVFKLSGGCVVVFL